LKKSDFEYEEEKVFNEINEILSNVEKVDELS